MTIMIMSNLIYASFDFINPFLANVPILYPLVFSGGIKWERWPEIGQTLFVKQFLQP